MFLSKLSVHSGLSFFFNLLSSRCDWEEKRVSPAVWLTTKYTLEGRNCCWHMEQDGLELRGLRGTCFAAAFSFWHYAKMYFLSSVWQSLPQGTRILNAQLCCGVAGWMDPLQTCESGRCWFQDQDHLECNEKKSAIASNQCIQLFLKKHCGNFFEPVCKPLERILSKYVQLDQASFVLKREFIRKYSENNKHHWEFLGPCPWIYEFML